MFTIEAGKTELRGAIRERAATWSDNKMSSRKKGGDKEELKDKPEWVDTLEKRLVSAMEFQSEMLLKRMVEMEVKMDEKIESIKKDMNKSLERIKKVEQKVNELEIDWKKERENLQDQLLLMECKFLDNYIRFRGVPENQKETREEMVNILSEFLELPQNDVEKECDEIYRVNSEFASIKKLPRDIIVKVVTHKMRDAILSKQYKEPMEILGKRIKIWKELPRDVIQQRKEFKQLLERLRHEQIRYRWEIPRGISFSYDNKRITIKTKAQMQEFLMSNKKDGEKARENQNNQDGN